MYRHSSNLLILGVTAHSNSGFLFDCFTQLIGFVAAIWPEWGRVACDVGVIIVRINMLNLL